MKIEVTQGCTKDSVQIDGKEFIELSHEQQLRAVKRIIEHCDEGTLQRMVIEYAESNSDDYNSHFCEQCGDIYETYKTEIK